MGIAMSGLMTIPVQVGGLQELDAVFSNPYTAALWKSCFY